MAIALIAIAVVVRRVTKTVSRLEERFDPLITKVNAISAQGKEISVHFNEISANLSTATGYLAESTQLIKEEVAELKLLVGETAITAKDKVAMVSQTIDRTHDQVIDTTEFVHRKIVEPAREIAAVMAGVKKGLEVLFAPAPKPLDRAYMEDELFIG
jgi:ABC-type transporter Mla subunit MlaD